MNEKISASEEVVKRITKEVDSAGAAPQQLGILSEKKINSQSKDDKSELNEVVGKVSNVVEDAVAFNLGSSLSFKLDSLPKAASDENVDSNMIDTTWLEETLREAYPDQQPLGLSVAEFATTILDILSSKRSSEDLQTELFDLCGFDRFDMIGAVLENREALVKSLKQNKLEMRAELSR